MSVKITNYNEKDVLRISLPLITGEILASIDGKIFVQNVSHENHSIVWPVVNGKFKILVRLRNGENKIIFQHKNSFHQITLIYAPLKSKRFVRLVYIKCKDDDGSFQAPQQENNSIHSACKRICLAGQMLQTFTSDKLKEHNLNRKTFCLEEQNDEIKCHVFTSSLSLLDAYKLSDEELWSYFAIELMNSKLRIGNDCKFLAFLSFTRYINNSNVLPRNHRDILRMTKGRVALGGGGLALFGSGCLHTWAENLQEVPWRFGDKRKIDRKHLMDDSANRGWYWACYSTGLGATLHELGHTFDLGHTNGGIMGRGFDDIHKHFIIDMFYHSHPFQKEYNPFYQEPSVQNQTVPLSLSSPLSWGPSLSTALETLHLDTKDKNSLFKVPSNFDCDNSKSAAERPWRIPNPPDSYSEETFAVHVGGAYWTRSSALILYFHKWFNEISGSEDAIQFDGTKLSSTSGIRVIEFRDIEGTSIHHLEFLDDGGSTLVDLTKFNILSNVPVGVSDISFIAEDGVGNILKSKLNISNLVN